MIVFQAANRVHTIEYSPVLQFMQYAKEVEAQGKEIIPLHLGDPAKFGFQPPEHVKQALSEAVKKDYNMYSPSEGLQELREAICEKERIINGVKITPEDVIVTSGVSEGILMLMAAMIDGRSEVLLPGPTYPPYYSYVKFFGGKAISCHVIEENGWYPDLDDIRSKVTDATKAIVIINPNNPSGFVYDEKILKEIIDIAGEHKLLVVSDEIYDRFTYEKPFVSTSTVASDVPVVGLNGFSKVYCMTGWRLGYLYFYDPEDKLTELKEGIRKQATMRLCASTPIQKAAIAALRGPQDHIKTMVRKLRQRRDYACKRLNEIEEVNCVKPEGAFYVFPKVDYGSRWKNDIQFVFDVFRKTGILLSPGSRFGRIYADHFRAVFLPPIETLRRVFDQLESILRRK